MQRRELEQRREENEYQKSQDTIRNQYEKDRLAADLEQAKLRNDLTRTQIAAQQKQMSDSDRDFAAAQAQLARTQSAHTRPLQQPNALKPQYIQVLDRFGKRVTIPNPDLYDLELPESVGAATLVLPERSSPWWQNLTKPGPAWQRMMDYFRGNPQGLPQPVETE